MTTTSPRPVVSTFVQRIDDERRTAEAALRVERQRQTDALEASIRTHGELASLLSRTPIEANQANEEAHASSSSPPPRRPQPVAGIDGRAVPPSSGPRSTTDLPPTPAQPSSASLPPATGSRLQELESQLARQDLRIQELEEERDGLTRLVEELLVQRDEAEELLDAAGAGTEAREERERREEVVAALQRQIAGLREERRGLERELDERRGTESELRRELSEERARARRLEAETQTLERADEIVALPAVAGSTLDAASRRGSAGESERRRHGHGRRHSSGSSIKFGLELEWGGGKEKKAKTKKDSRH